MASTTVPVSDDTWKQLNQMKERGETFDDVIGRLLSEVEIEA